LPVPLCVGLGVAAELAAAEMPAESERLLGLRRRFLARLRSCFPRPCSNGDAERRLPGNLNISFPGLSASDLMDACPDVAVSSGSACTSAELEPSYVLRALGLSDELAGASIRIGFGRMTTEDEVDRAADRLTTTARELALATAPG